MFLLLLILFLTTKCSISQDAERAIVQGTLAKLGQFPYIVHLISKPTIPNPPFNGSVCTGAILTDLWVVTAAHCFKKMSKHNVSMKDVSTEVIAGSIDLNVKHDQKRNVMHIVFLEPNPENKLPPQYNNDINIVKVSQPFDFNANVKPITVAKRPLPDGQKLTCTQVGYGQTDIPSDKEKLGYTTKLYYTYGTLDDVKESCKKRQTPKNPQYSKFWGEDLLCVDQVNRWSTVCYGDSGGPLVCDGLHVGILAIMTNPLGKNTTCGSGVENYYTIYAFLGIHEPWLRKHIPELPAFKYVRGRQFFKGGASSGGGDNVLRAADIALVVLIDCFILVRVHFNFRLTFGNIYL